MHIDAEACYRAVASRDARFDGRFFMGVTSTGIYCRPICPARTPARRNVRFFACAAAAEDAGFRACRRCRPERSPDAPGWNVRADLVAQALAAIDGGAVDDEGVRGLARRLAVSERHLHRLFVAELGAGPLAVARTRRARLARVLLDEDLPLSEVAFSAGYASIRQFNDSIRAAYGATPTELRRSGGAAAARPAAVHLRLPVRAPFDGPALRDFLAGRAMPGVEEVRDDRYRRAVGDSLIEVVLRADEARLAVRLGPRGNLAGVVARVRALCDLNTEPDGPAAVLRADPLLSPLVAARPGLRVPGSVDGFECAVRAVLGQQVSVAAAVTLAGRLAERHGTPLDAPDGSLTHRFPAPDALVDADLSGLGITGTRIEALRALARAVVAGDLVLDGEAARDARTASETVARLRGLPGFGPWTAATVAMRGLRDPDAWPAGDLGLRRALAARGGDGSVRGLAERAQAWRPWRAYAATHLWSAGTDHEAVSA